MPNLHPPLSAFPVALLITVLLLELAGFYRSLDSLALAKRVNLWLAAFFTLAAFFSGYPASEEANQTFEVADQAIATHHAYGRLLLFLVLPCVALEYLSAKVTPNRAVWRFMYLLSLLACVALVMVTGYLGGELVFSHGAGVRAELP